MSWTHREEILSDILHSAPVLPPVPVPPALVPVLVLVVVRVLLAEAMEDSAVALLAVLAQLPATSVAGQTTSPATARLRP